MTKKETNKSSELSLKLALILVAIITVCSFFLIYQIEASPELRLYCCLASLILGAMFVHDILKEPDASLSKHLLSRLSKTLTLNILGVFRQKLGQQTIPACNDGECGQCKVCKNEGH